MKIKKDKSEQINEAGKTSEKPFDIPSDLVDDIEEPKDLKVEDKQNAPAAITPLKIKTPKAPSPDIEAKPARFHPERVGYYAVPLKNKETGEVLLDAKGNPRVKEKIMSHSKAKKMGYQAVNRDVNEGSARGNQMKEVRARQKMGRISKPSPSGELTFPTNYGSDMEAMPTWLDELGIVQRETKIPHTNETMTSFGFKHHSNPQAVAGLAPSFNGYTAVLGNGTHKEFARERDAMDYIKKYLRSFAYPELTKAAVVKSINTFLRKAGVLDDSDNC